MVPVAVEASQMNLLSTALRGWIVRKLFASVFCGSIFVYFYLFIFLSFYIFIFLSFHILYFFCLYYLLFFHFFFFF